MWPFVRAIGEGLTCKMSALKLFMVANLHYLDLPNVAQNFILSWRGLSDLIF